METRRQEMLEVNMYPGMLEILEEQWEDISNSEAPSHLCVVCALLILDERLEMS